MNMSMFSWKLLSPSRNIHIIEIITPLEWSGKTVSSELEIYPLKMESLQREERFKHKELPFTEWGIQPGAQIIFGLSAI